MNVLFELETDGDEDIWTQELKLSEDTWNDPEHEVPDEFVVTVVVSIVSEKVTEIVEFTETEVSESDGDVEETVGDVVSDNVLVVNPLDVVHWLLNVFPEMSITSLVTRIL